MGGRGEGKGGWRQRQPPRQTGLDNVLSDFQRNISNMEALGAMTQLAMRMQPALANMQLRKPDQGQISIQDRASIFANACSPQAGNSSPTITTLERPNEPEHQPEVKKLRRDLGSLTKQVDLQAEQIANQTAKIDSIAVSTTVSAKESKAAAVAAAHTNTMVQQLLNKTGSPAVNEWTPTTPTRPRQQPRTPTGLQQQERSTCLRMRQTGTHDGEQQRQQQLQANSATESDESHTGQLVFRDGPPTPLFSQTVDK